MATPNEKPLRLTGKQSAFCLCYVSTANFNGTEAARQAKYSGNDATLRSIAYENLTKPHIRAEIDRLLEAHVMGKQEVLARLHDHASGSLEDFIDVAPRYARRPDGSTVEVYDIGRINLEKAQQAGKLHLLKKYRVTKAGIAIELHDPQAALVQLAKHYGLLKDETTINLNVQMELIVKVVRALEEAGEDAESVLQRLFERAKERAEAKRNP